jgi:hypothetical protein
MAKLINQGEVEVTNRERFLIGGIGGLMPVLMFLATGDFARFFTNSFVLTAVGYCVRAIILFFVGGFVVCLYRDEKHRMKIFHLGLGAPAMIAGFLATQPNSIPTARAHMTLNGNFIAVVQAQVSPNRDELKRFTLPVPSPTAQFLEGLVGIQPKNVWFVISGSYLSFDNAKESAKKINDSHPDFHADVYAPYQDNPNYAVVIGANLTQSQAKALKAKAISAGLARDTYYKTFPNLPSP